MFNSILHFPLIIIPEILYGSEKQHLDKGNQLAENEPDVDHLDVRKREREFIVLKECTRVLGGTLISV